MRVRARPAFTRPYSLTGRKRPFDFQAGAAAFQQLGSHRGGVAAVLDQGHDNFKLHIADTLIAGKYKNNLAAIEVLVTEGPKDVLRLRELGVDFDRDEKGHLMMTLEAGHSRHRIVHHKDSTGKAITDTLIEAVKERGNADIMGKHHAVFPAKGARRFLRRADARRLRGMDWRALLHPGDRRGRQGV